MDSKLNSLARTKEELDQLVEGLGRLRQASYKKEEEWERVLEQEVEARLARIVREEVGKVKDRGDYLGQVLEELKKKEVARMILAVWPSERLITRISDWAGKYLGRGVVVDIEVDTEIGGGMKLEWQGRLFDQSLASWL